MPLRIHLVGCVKTQLDHPAPVAPETVIEPYDFPLAKQPRAFRERWGESADAEHRRRGPTAASTPGSTSRGTGRLSTGPPRSPENGHRVPTNVRGTR